MTELEVFPEDWQRALAVAAHPDDMEYGASSAVARWTSQGKDICYVLVTRGEAGVASLAPDVAAPLRVDEQRRSCAAVGVDDVVFLDHPDGLVEATIGLRRDLAREIRRHRPEVLLGVNYRNSWGGPSWNHADHRAVGVALLDASRDAANPWVFPDTGEAWGGVRLTAFSGSPYPTHGVDVTTHIEAGVDSLRCHETYLANLGGDMADPDAWLRAAAASNGPRIGVDLAVTFEVIGG